MKNEIVRRVFVKRLAGLSLGACLIPKSLFFCKYNHELLNTHNSTAESEVHCQVDWQKMMKDHDLVWNNVPLEMKEAPHFGNGLLGSMLWVEENKIRLQIFRADVHDHADHTYGWSAYSRPRYQIGYLLLEPKGEIISCNLRQDIYNAELIGRINTSLGNISIHHLVHRLDDVIYTETEAIGGEELSGWEWHPFEAKSSRGGDPGEERYGKTYAPYNKLENPEHIINKQDNINVSLQDLTHGGNYATAWEEYKIEDAKTGMLISIEYCYPEKESSGKAIAIIKKVQHKIAKNRVDWIAEHRLWWHNYYPESFVTFPDSIGQSFYWGNIYRLACCTRPDAQYIDTPGMWSSGGPWPYSTHDFNTQTVHFPIYTANRLHLGEALVESMYRNRENLIENVVPEEWQEDSAFLPLATAYDLRGKRYGDMRYSELVGCLPWLLHNIWLHYRYTMNNEMLRVKLFPILRRSINFYRHLLYKGDDGKFHLPPTYSPEIGNTDDCNMDLALLKWGCQRLIQICDILDIDDPLIPEWKNIEENLVDYPTDEYGYRMGKDKTAPLGHRHMSHLMMIYPLYLENIDNTSNIDLLEKSVRNYEPNWAPKMGASQSSPAAAALGLGNLAYQRMNDILFKNLENETLGKNGIYYLATPCIETSLSYNTCVQDMLLQSWGNKIRVFPALPDSWKEVAFHNFRTGGAFLISAKRKNGKTSFVRIKSLAGEPCIIIPAIEKMKVIKSRNKNNIEEIEKGCYRIDIKKGEEVVLYTGNEKPDLVIQPLSPGKDVTNRFFGK